MLATVIILSVVVVAVRVLPALIEVAAGLILAAKVIAPLVVVGVAGVISRKGRVGVVAAAIAYGHHRVHTGREAQGGYGRYKKEKGAEFHEVWLMDELGFVERTICRERGGGAQIRPVRSETMKMMTRRLAPLLA